MSHRVNHRRGETRRFIHRRRGKRGNTNAFVLAKQRQMMFAIDTAFLASERTNTSLDIAYSGMLDGLIIEDPRYIRKWDT